MPTARCPDLPTCQHCHDRRAAVREKVNVYRRGWTRGWYWLCSVCWATAQRVQRASSASPNDRTPAGPTLPALSVVPDRIVPPRGPRPRTLDDYESADGAPWQSERNHWSQRR